VAALLNNIIPLREGVDARIAHFLRDQAVAQASTETRLRELIAQGFDRIPLPGHGATLKRWQALEQIARHDLSLVKLYESHTDALAILHEIDTRHMPRPGVLYAVWASESGIDPITIWPDSDAATDQLHSVTHDLIDGRRSWCPGAAVVDVALMTAHDTRGRRFLVEVDMKAPGIHIDGSRWHAIGMHDCGSFDVVCVGVPARIVGHVNGYLDRPGFWHGGAGIAACWFGAAAEIGTRVRDLQVGRDDVHALAHLGAIDAALASGAALLRECACMIDAKPAEDAVRIALRARGAIADMVETVIHHAGRAIGPGPLCGEADFARRIADLPIFVRQSRTEHDRVSQSRAMMADPAVMQTAGWPL
jgi:hypothetical protein